MGRGDELLGGGGAAAGLLTAGLPGGVELTVRGTVEGIDAAGFADLARQAKETCPVSQALAGTEITLGDVDLR